MNLDFNFKIPIDYWHNAQRITLAKAKAFVNTRQWWRRRPGIWASADAVVTLEIVPSDPMSALVWIVDL